MWFTAEPLLSTNRKVQWKRRSKQVSDNACSNSHTVFFILTGCNHERLPSWKRGWHVQQLPCWRWTVGCDGVSGGRRFDRYSDSHEVGWVCCAGTSSVNPTAGAGQEGDAAAFLHGCLRTVPSRPHILLRGAGYLLALYLYFYICIFIAVYLYLHTTYI